MSGIHESAPAALEPPRSMVKHWKVFDMAHDSASPAPVIVLPDSMLLFTEEDLGYLTPCWVWRGTKNAGYGLIYRDGRMYRAHRVMYESLIGDIPSNLDLDHLCRVRACVNPDHLEPVTPRINTLRGIGPTAVNAKKTHCVHGHRFDESNTRWTSRGRRDCRECERLRSQRRRDAQKALNALVEPFLSAEGA